MPKKVLAHLVQALESDITTHFQPGDRYRTMREIAREQQVSLATATKAVALLSQRGLLRRASRDGLHVLQRVPTARQQKQVAVISRQPDPRFNAAFLVGITTVFSADATRATLHVNTEIDPASLTFGDWMLGLEADGYICLATAAESALPYYHLIKAGKPLVSDWAIDTLPILPVVQTNNQEHCRRLAQRLVKLQKSDCLVASFFRNRGQRHEIFAEHLRRLLPGPPPVYCDMAKPAALGLIAAFIEEKQESRAIVSLDFETNHLLVPLMQQAGHRASERFFLYDSEEETFLIPQTEVRLQPQAHGLCHLGLKLAEKLRYHFHNNQWPAPLVERV